MPDNWIRLGALAETLARDAEIERLKRLCEKSLASGNAELAEEYHSRMVDAEALRWLDERSLA